MNTTPITRCNKAAAILGAALLCSSAAWAAEDWRTPAEIANFATTPRYEETLAYLERLQKAAPGKLHLERFGTTPEGRPLMMVVANAQGIFTAPDAKAKNLPVVLVQAGIHSGEIEGKDAGLMLLRDIAVTGRQAHLVDHAVLVFVPVYNVDGHEKASPYNRINQNGPAEMGARGQAQYLNLNRDYMKADAPETAAFLTLWQSWRPDLFIDVHTTDGADYQPDLTYYLESPNKLFAKVSQWQRQAMAKILPLYEARGHLAAPYLDFADGTDPRKGIVNFGSGPRFSTGYAALQNRPALLVETHMLKPYAVRVRAAYDIVSLLLNYAGQHASELLAANSEADAATIARASDPAAKLALTFKLSPQTEDYTLKGFAFSTVKSEISGDDWIRYDPTKKQSYVIPNRDQLLPDLTITPPAAYAVPAPWQDVIARLKAHGLTTITLRCPSRFRAAGYQIDTPHWSEQPFEGHHLLRSFSLSSETRDTILPPGSVIVPLHQSSANVAIGLLEPQAPDSLLRWGFFDAVFEAKEYGEPRVVEKLARDMLEKSPELAKAFAEKRQSDPQFAQSPQAQLEFFFKRSPWYGVQAVGRYPVLRLDQNSLTRLPKNCGP